MGRKIRRKIQSVCVREEVKAERIGRTTAAAWNMVHDDCQTERR